MKTLVTDIAAALEALDASLIPFRHYQPGVGPYGEPQLVAAVAEWLDTKAPYSGRVVTKRTPDLLIQGLWALEFKLVRPFGDNGKLAENWSVNLLHPYPDNTSALGDCVKLMALDRPERKGIIVICYEHTPPQVTIQPLVNGFELLAKHVMHIELSERVSAVRAGLVHPIHQQLTVFGWEVLGRTQEPGMSAAGK